MLAGTLLIIVIFAGHLKEGSAIFEWKPKIQHIIVLVSLTIISFVYLITYWFCLKRERKLLREQRLREMKKIKRKFNERISYDMYKHVVKPAPGSQTEENNQRETQVLVH